MPTVVLSYHPHRNETADAPDYRLLDIALSLIAGGSSAWGAECRVEATRNGWRTPRIGVGAIRAWGIAMLRWMAE